VYNDKANQAIINAVRATNWTTTAVPFGEICLTLAKTSDFALAWMTERSWNTEAFYSFAGNGDTNCLPVGDLIGTGPWQNLFDPDNAPPTFYLSLSSQAPPSGFQPALAHPTGFNWLVDDSGSRNQNNIVYWQPVAPEGYQALGICFNANEPNAENYWCVRNDLCLGVSTITVWSDAGAGWNNNGNVLAPAVSQNAIDQIPDGNILLSPLSYTYDGVPAYMLNVPQAMLDVQSFDFPDPQIPVMDPKVVAGDKLPAGLSPVIIIPFSAIPTDSNFPNQPYSSPFYFVAAQPYYYCYNVFSPTGGGQTTVTYNVGVTAEDSVTFEASTSITASVDVGATFEVENASASLSLTSAFSLTVNSNYTVNTSEEYQILLTFPIVPFVYQWQLMSDLVVTRSDGTQIKSIPYMNKDAPNLPAPVPTGHKNTVV
jgi:hypothetical protein